MKESIISSLARILNKEKKEIEKSIETPPSPELGDYAFPCFSLSKDFKKSPIDIAKDIVSKIKFSSEIEKVEASGPYINFFINRKKLAERVLKNILKEKDKYGSFNEGNKKTILIDMSSPNIAKPFGIGHLRSTIIGNSISNIYKKLGYNVIKINYLGDWGTQFGKLIVGYKRKFNKEKFKKEPINHLLELYIEGNKEEYEEEARQWFKKLEQGNKEAISLWKNFKSASIKEFNKIYKFFNIRFDVISGESLYGKKMPAIIEELKSKNLLKKSEGAEGVDLDEFGLGFCLIKKNDGTTLYATRDIALAIDRYKEYKFHKVIYEVGQEQKLHFQQFFKVLELMGYQWAKDCIHVSHGLYLDKDGKKFATREGKTVFMEDIIKEVFDLSKKEIQKREKINKNELEKRAKAITTSAIFYGDLKNYRANDMTFDIQKFISFEGDTGPYLLYTYARAKSILKKSNSYSKKISINEITDKEKKLISLLSGFSEVIDQSLKNLSPNIIANYSFQLAQCFNEFYHSEQVIGSKNEQQKLLIVEASAQVLKNSLSLLGIPVIERM